MNYSSNGEPAYSMQRRRHANISPRRAASPEHCQREVAADVARTSQYHKPTSMQPPEAHSVRRHKPRRLAGPRPEQESYYEAYYAQATSPPKRTDVHVMQPVDDDEEEEEGEEEEEDEETDAVSYPSSSSDQPSNRCYRVQDYYPALQAREAAYYDPYVSQAQRKVTKSPARSYDIFQPASDGVLPSRPRSPVAYTRQQMTEPLQSKTTKLSTRSFYDSEGRHYTPSHSLESNYYERSRGQDYHLYDKQQREKLLQELRQEREGEDLKQIFPSREDAVVAEGDELAKTAQQCPLTPEDCLNLTKKEGEYLKKLKMIFQQEAKDVERLFVTKNAEIERRGPRNKSPVGRYRQS